MPTVALLFSNYGPYHLARLRGFAEHCQATSWQAVGIELARSEIEYPWQSDLSQFPVTIHSVITDRPLEQVSSGKLISRLLQTLHHINPDVIAISGYARLPMQAALLWARWHRKPAILFSETTEVDAVRTQWREALKQWIVKQFQAAVVGGHPHQRYLVKLGLPAEAIFPGYDVVDNSTFQPEQLATYAAPLSRPYFLAINRFIAKKNLPFLLAAYAAYRQQLNETAWDLVLCGDGELRPQLEQQITSLGLGDCVHLPGFLQQEQLLPYFAHAGCFIHASIQEQWGLVVNEAMAAGLPVLVSNRCGCFEDLVIEGVNGFGFDPTNPSELVNLMVKLSSGAVDREAMGKASLRHIQKYSPDYFAQGLMQAVNYAIAHA